MYEKHARSSYLLQMMLKKLSPSQFQSMTKV